MSRLRFEGRRDSPQGGEGRGIGHEEVEVSPWVVLWADSCASVPSDVLVPACLCSAKGEGGSRMGLFPTDLHSARPASWLRAGAVTSKTCSRRRDGGQERIRYS